MKVEIKAEVKAKRGKNQNIVILHQMKKYQVQIKRIKKGKKDK